MTLRLAAAALLLAMPLGGCAVAAVGAVGAVGLAAAQDKTLGEAVDDTTTSGEIKAKLLSESINRFGEVDVEVNGGLVLLTPQTGSRRKESPGRQRARMMSPTRSRSNRPVDSSQMCRTKSYPAACAHA